MLDVKLAIGRDPHFAPDIVDPLDEFLLCHSITPEKKSSSQTISARPKLGPCGNLELIVEVEGVDFLRADVVH